MYTHCRSAFTHYLHHHILKLLVIITGLPLFGWQVMQQQLEAFRAQQAANARDISSLRAERDLALDQLTDLQDLVDAEESLLVRCT